MVKRRRSSLEETSEFFTNQAEWTAPMRRYLYRKAGLRRRAAVLDAGCGTGEVTAEIAGLTGGSVTGVDFETRFIEYAAERHPGIRFIHADCEDLPFDDGAFDLVTCHFLLMWVPKPARAVVEMARVLEPGGILLACAEPDYGGRVEYPEHPEFTAALDSSLSRKGADIRLGRRLGVLFREAGLGVEVGVSATVWDGELLEQRFEGKKGKFRRDLEAVLEKDEAGRVLDEESAQVKAGKMLMVPLFWALGFKSG